MAREVLKDYEPAPGLWPTAHLPAQKRRLRRAAVADWIEHVVGNS